MDRPTGARVLGAAVAAACLAGAAYGEARTRVWFEVDKCTDWGGRWDHVAGRCVEPRDPGYVPVAEHPGRFASWGVLLALCLLAGWAAYRLALRARGRPSRPAP